MTNVTTKPVETTHAILGKTSFEGVMLGISKFDTSKVLFKLTNEATIKKLQTYAVNIKDDAVNREFVIVKFNKRVDIHVSPLPNLIECCQ